MREIKFRGISKEKGIFVYGCYIKASDEKEEIHAILEIEKSIDCITEVIKESIGQFTGIQDKNGVEIYDGDIIKRSTGYVFLEKQIFFSLGSRSSASAFGYDYHQDDEIIGNIHEHPNLLK